MARQMPESVKRIFEKAKSVNIKPVESTASVLFERHGLEFEKDAIRAVMVDQKKKPKRLVQAR